MNGYCTFLSLGRYGRFANQIFQIASTIGIARKNGLEPVFPLWINHDHKVNFKSNEDVDIWKHLVNPIPIIPDDISFPHDITVQWGYHDIKLSQGRNYNLAGHMQSTKFFEHCLDEVRERLRFRLEPPLQKSVAIHVRRGDYDNKYHPRIGMEYYLKAMQHFPPDTLFQVFSDDIHAVKIEFEVYFETHCMRHLLKRFRFVNYDEPMYDYIESFNLMKSCSGFIIGNSSFSAAAAILSTAPGKKVIAPANWFGQAYAGIDAKDIHCPEWIVI